MITSPMLHHCPPFHPPSPRMSRPVSSGTSVKLRSVKKSSLSMKNAVAFEKFYDFVVVPVHERQSSPNCVGGLSRPRIPQIRVSNTRLAQAASGCAPSVDVLPIFDVKQQSVRNPARMGAKPTSLSRFSYNKRFWAITFDPTSAPVEVILNARTESSVTPKISVRDVKVKKTREDLCDTCIFDEESSMKYLNKNCQLVILAILVHHHSEDQSLSFATKFAVPCFLLRRFTEL
ncbi:hypothetical protein WN51_00213 [Melipona quadrifasciata]|uniref:Uncharacterized protein n=1 Tax=Melipona quadrifasciata TaxID=166423 RepID=A0A0M9ABS1_9HYME|nr:hypothetical protein WN51_00213 [Melipona quadrifasciata]